MTYSAVVEMARSESLISRITAAAAAEGVDQPETWVRINVWRFATQPGWADSWAYAKQQATINQNPDTGQRDDVITDGSILSSVQALKPAAP